MNRATTVEQPDAAPEGLERLATSAHKGIDAAADAVSKASATGEQYYAAGTGYVRDHPVLTIGVVGGAVAAGYLLSRLLTTR